MFDTEGARLFLQLDGRTESDERRVEIAVPDSLLRRFVVLLTARDRCNLACRYCFLSKKSDRVMEDRTLQAVVRSFMGTFRGDEPALLEFLFHGPEITQDVACIERAIEYQLRFHKELGIRQPLYLADCREGETPFISNTMQSNATLVTGDLFDVMRRGNFQGLSVSLDGPQDIHDANRMFEDGEGSFDRVMDSVRRAKDAGFPVFAVAVLTKQGVGRAREIYDFFVAEGISFRMIPVVTPLADQSFAISPKEYATTIAELVDLYLADPNDHPRFITADQYMEIVLSSVMYLRKPDGSRTHLDFVEVSDVFSVACQAFMCTVAPNGDIYPCESLMDYEEFRFGSIHDGLDAVLAAEMRTSMLSRAARLQECHECEFLHMCYGGCPSNAFRVNKSLATRDPFCDAYQAIFRHVSERLAHHVSVASSVPEMD